MFGEGDSLMQRAYLLCNVSVSLCIQLCLSKPLAMFVDGGVQRLQGIYALLENCSPYGKNNSHQLKANVTPRKYLTF